MAKFLSNVRRIVSKVQAIHDGELEEEDFDPQLLFHQGMPSDAISLAHDGYNCILAIGTTIGDIKLFRNPPVEKLLSSGRSSGIKHLMFSVSRKYKLVAISEDSLIQIWDVEKMKVDPLHMGVDICCACVIPESGFIAVGCSDNLVRFVSVEDCIASESSIAAPKDVMKSNPDFEGELTIVGLECNPTYNHELLIAFSNGVCALWNLKSKRLIRKYAIPKALNCISWSPNGKFFAAAYKDGVVSIWNTKNEKHPIHQALRTDEDEKAIKATKTLWVAVGKKQYVFIIDERGEVHYFYGEKFERSEQLHSCENVRQIKDFSHSGDVSGLYVLMDEPEQNFMMMKLRNVSKGKDSSGLVVAEFPNPYSFRFNRDNVIKMELHNLLPVEVLADMSAASISSHRDRNWDQDILGVSGGSLDTEDIPAFNSILVIEEKSAVKFFDASTAELVPVDFWDVCSLMPAGEDGTGAACYLDVTATSFCPLSRTLAVGLSNGATVVYIFRGFPRTLALKSPEESVEAVDVNTMDSLKANLKRIKSYSKIDARSSSGTPATTSVENEEIESDEKQLKLEDDEAKAKLTAEGAKSSSDDTTQEKTKEKSKEEAKKEKKAQKSFKKIPKEAECELEKGDEDQTQPSAEDVNDTESREQTVKNDSPDPNKGDEEDTTREDEVEECKEEQEEASDEKGEDEVNAKPSDSESEGIEYPKALENDKEDVAQEETTCVSEENEIMENVDSSTKDELKDKKGTQNEQIGRKEDNPKKCLAGFQPMATFQNKIDDPVTNTVLHTAARMVAIGYSSGRLCIYKYEISGGKCIAHYSLGSAVKALKIAEIKESLLLFCCVADVALCFNLVNGELLWLDELPDSAQEVLDIFPLNEEGSPMGAAVGKWMNGEDEFDTKPREYLIEVPTEDLETHYLAILCVKKALIYQFPSGFRVREEKIEIESPTGGHIYSNGSSSVLFVVNSENDMVALSLLSLRKLFRWKIDEFLFTTKPDLTSVSCIGSSGEMICIASDNTIWRLNLPAEGDELNFGPASPVTSRLDLGDGEAMLSSSRSVFKKFMNTLSWTDWNELFNVVPKEEISPEDMRKKLLGLDVESEPAPDSGRKSDRSAPKMSLDDLDGGPREVKKDAKSAKIALSEAMDKLNERGESINRVSEKTSELTLASQNFAETARLLRENAERKRKKKRKFSF